jgi:hypothetical protein
MATVEHVDVGFMAAEWVRVRAGSVSYLRRSEEHVVRAAKLQRGEVQIECRRQLLAVP